MIMNRNYKSVDKFGINVQEKLDVLKNVKALRRDMLSIRINIEKKYRIILDQMILKTSFISDDVNEANGICSLRNKMEKINTSIAKLKSISLDMTLLAEFGALPEKWYYKLSRDIEGVRRYLMSWQKYWINEIKDISDDMRKMDDLYFPEFKNNKLNYCENLKDKRQKDNRENNNDFEIAYELFDNTDELIKNSVIKAQKLKEIRRRKTINDILKSKKQKTINDKILKSKKQKTINLIKLKEIRRNEKN